MRLTLALVFAVCLLSPGVSAAQTGDDVYRAACTACHGEDGRGVPQAQLGFEIPVPDFTDCSFATPETSADWLAIAHDGGPVRAFDRRMPAFGEALPLHDLVLAVEHVRAFCQDTAWPRGELNLPRALVTEKAFPENETVFDAAIGIGAARGVRQRVVYEHRIRARTQYEVVVPFEVSPSDGSWAYGLGDVAIALKSALLHSSARGSIFAVGGEVVLPTGKEALGLGGGVTKVEPYVAFGQILPHDAFLQLQGGFESAVTGDDREHEAFWRSAIGMTWVEGRFGRAWTPIVEVVGGRALEAGARPLWDIVPQVQVSLSRRQHILLNVGVRTPVNQRTGRGAQVLTYLLWDWFDGGFFDGWR